MRYLFLLFTVLFSFENVFSQDLEFTQFYSNPVYLNPAFAGAYGCPRFALNYRNQWPNLSGNYVSYAASYDQYFKALSGGIGLVLVNDVQAKTINTTSGSLVYSYHTKINRKWSMLFGVKATLVNKSLDGTRLTYNDMIDDRKGFVYASNDNVKQTSFSFFDASAGLLVFSKTFNFGLAANHLTQPQESMIGGLNNRLPMRITAHTSATIVLSKDSKFISGTSIMPSVIYSYQNGFSQLNLGAYVKHSALTIGAWLRNRDAFIITLGVSTNIIKIGYSYDVTVSKLNILNSGGSHELSLGLNLNCKTPPQKFKTVSCPSF